MPYAAIAGAAIGAIGSYLDRKNQSEAADSAYDAQMYGIDQNTAIAEANMAQQQAQFEAQMAWAEELRRKEELGGGNEFGDRYYFDENLGWVVDNTPASQMVSEAGRRQDRLNRTVIDSQNRNRADRLVGLQSDEGQVANNLMDEYRSIDPTTGTQVGDVNFAASGANRNALLDALGERQFTQQLRYGDSSNASNVIGAQAGAAAKTARGDLGDRMMSIQQGGGDITANQRGQVADQYNNMRDKSVQAWTPQFSPVSAQNFTTGSTAGSNSAMSAALGNMAREQPYVPTNYAEYNRNTANNAADKQLYGDLAKFGLSAWDEYSNSGNRQQGNTTPGRTATTNNYDEWNSSNNWF